VDENAAKAIIERVGCPQCHAYVQKKTGPPMKNIQEKYKGDWECVVSRLTKNKTHKEEGVTDDMKGNEYKIVADYIATRAK
jgi:cytochrome c551/c552